MIIYKQYFLIFNIFITVTYQICKMAPKHQKSLKKIAFEEIIQLPKFWDYICKFAYNLYYNTYEIRYWEPEKKEPTRGFCMSSIYNAYTDITYRLVRSSSRRVEEGVKVMD